MSLRGPTHHSPHPPTNPVIKQLSTGLLLVGVPDRHSGDISLSFVRDDVGG